MKKNILLFSILLIFLSSCKKEFLELTSKNDLTTVVYYKTQSDFVAAIVGAYAPLRTLYSMSWQIDEEHSDNTHYFYQPAQRSAIDGENLTSFIIDPANAIILTYYRTNYLTIARANQVLQPIDAAAFTDESVRNNIKGQALFLRALGYFNLVQHYGDVPLHLTPVTNYDQTFLPLSAADIVYAQIISDLTSAIDLLPLKGAEGEKGRITMGAAQMMLANVYMVQKNWTGAEILLKSIITSGKYALLPNYADVFQLTNKNSIESLFEIQYKDGTEGFNSTFFWTFIPKPISAATLRTMTGIATISDQNTQGYNIPTPDVIAAFESGDLRKDASIGYLVNTNGVTAPFCKKYFHKMTIQGYSDDDFPIYRYSEVLLFLAEAINEQGGRSAEALEYLNQVRNRAGLANSIAADQTSIRIAVAHERRVEFLFENKRWPDLLRTGKAQEVMTAFGAKVIANPQAYYFPAGITPPTAAYQTINLVFPLPAVEAGLNPYF